MCACVCKYVFVFVWGLLGRQLAPADSYRSLNSMADKDNQLSLIFTYTHTNTQTNRHKIKHDIYGLQYFMKCWRSFHNLKVHQAHTSLAWNDNKQYIFSSINVNWITKEQHYHEGKNNLKFILCPIKNLCKDRKYGSCKRPTSWSFRLFCSQNIPKFDALPTANKRQIGKNKYLFITFFFFFLMCYKSITSELGISRYLKSNDSRVGGAFPSYCWAIGCTLNRSPVTTARTRTHMDRICIISPDSCRYPPLLYGDNMLWSVHDKQTSSRVKYSSEITRLKYKEESL